MTASVTAWEKDPGGPERIDLSRIPSSQMAKFGRNLFEALKAALDDPEIRKELEEARCEDAGGN